MAKTELWIRCQPERIGAQFVEGFKHNLDPPVDELVLVSIYGTLWDKYITAASVLDTNWAVGQPSRTAMVFAVPRLPHDY
jgi:hypothetical protein